VKRLLPLLAVLTLLVPATAGAAPIDDLELLGREQINPRLTELTFETPAIDGPIGVRVLLPRGYDRPANRDRDYPSLYLLHGAGYDQRGWTEEGDAQAIIGDAKLIVVMPAGGGNGYYSDWHNAGAGGPPAYETFHIRQVLPYVDRSYRTDARRSRRAIAGFSMAGLGALSYAARNPDLFVAAASFSGAVDTNYPPFIPIGEGSSVFDGGPYAAIWGPRLSEEVRWRAHNPWDLAESLRGTYLELRTGNGLGGGEFGGPPFDAIEYGVHEMNISLDRRLDELGIEHVYEDYGPGAHEFPYYSASLRKTLPGLLSTLADSPPRLPRFTYRAVEPRYRVGGYKVAIERPALEFSQLEADRDGRRFTLTGSGEAIVQTPPTLRPNTTHRVLITTAESESERMIRSDRRGRLLIDAPLGAGNRFQQHTLAALAAGTREQTVEVVVSSLSPQH